MESSCSDDSEGSWSICELSSQTGYATTREEHAGGSRNEDSTISEESDGIQSENSEGAVPEPRSFVIPVFSSHEHSKPAKKSRGKPVQSLFALSSSVFDFPGVENCKDGGSSVEMSLVDHLSLGKFKLEPQTRPFGKFSSSSDNQCSVLERSRDEHIEWSYNIRRHLNRIGVIMAEIIYVAGIDCADLGFWSICSITSESPVEIRDLLPPENIIVEDIPTRSLLFELPVYVYFSYIHLAPEVRNIKNLHSKVFINAKFILVIPLPVKLSRLASQLKFDRNIALICSSYVDLSVIPSH